MKKIDCKELYNQIIQNYSYEKEIFLKDIYIPSEINEKLNNKISNYI